MIEFGVQSFEKISSFSGTKKAVASKPLLTFLGSQWETDALYARAQILLLDLFRGTKFEKIALQGIDHVLSFTVVDGVIHMRAYAVAFKKSSTKVHNHIYHIYAYAYINAYIYLYYYLSILIDCRHYYVTTFINIVQIYIY